MNVKYRKPQNKLQPTIAMSPILMVNIFLHVAGVFKNKYT